MLSTLFAICGFHPRQPSESDLVLQGYTALDQWLNAAVKKSMHQAGVTGMGVAVINTDAAMAYSNIGFSLAGVAIEQVSGLSFEEYMQRNVVTRLGMAASSFSPRAEHPQLSLSYINGKPVTIQSYPSPYTAGIIAALGWMRVPSNLPCGHDLVWHNGQTLGHSALVYLSCQAGLGIVMLSNSPATEVMDSLARDIMGHAYTIRYGGKQHKTTASMAESLPGTATSAEGQYVSTAGLITVPGQGDRYYTEFSGQKWQLDEIAAGQYKARLRLLGFVPVASKELRAATIHIRQVSVASGNDKLVFIEGDGAQQFLASSVLPQEPPPIWADRTGEYELVTRLHESKFLSIGPVELGLRDGIYVVVLSIDDQTVDYPLAFHGDNGASVQGFGRMLGAALEFVQPDSFDLMGLRFKRLTG